jgi:hypothetical protein
MTNTDLQAFGRVDNDTATTTAALGRINSTMLDHARQVATLLPRSASGPA